jgi:hypothetical protein
MNDSNLWSSSQTTSLASLLALVTYPKIAIDGNYLRVTSGTHGEQVSHYFIQPPEEECD